MDWALVGAIVTGAITLVGVVAGIIQILQYVTERREKKLSTKRQDRPLNGQTKSSVHEESNISNNLPSVGAFVGRDDERKYLQDAIKSESRLVVIEGVGGIGKTSLSLQVAHTCLEESLRLASKRTKDQSFFGAFVWVTAKASPITIEHLLDAIARTLDYPYISQLSLDEKTHEILRLLRKIKTLIIIDNFETITDDRVAQFINDVPEPSKVLITTRYQRFWNIGYLPLSLGKLQRDEGLELIIDEARRIGIESLTQADHSFLVDLYEATGGSPLAIKWAIGQIKQRGQSINSVLDILKSARGDIFEIMFARSWGLLSDASKSVLLTVPIFATTVSREALEATSNIHSFEFGEALGQLCELWLIEANRELLRENQRFSVHPLTRAFVTRELSKAPALKDEMWLRAAEYYLQFCNERRYLQHGIKDYDQIEAEMSNILRVIEWLHDSCKSEASNISCCSLLVRFSGAVNVFFWSRGYWSERVSLCERALEGSKTLKDWTSAGKQAYFIGIVRSWQGIVEEAEKWADISKSFMERTGNIVDIALTQRLSGLILMGKGDYEHAIATHKLVLEHISEVESVKSEEIRVFADWVCPGSDGHKAGLVSLMQELGIIANSQGDHLTALKWLEDSRKLAQQIGDNEGLSISLSHLGHALLALGRLKEAKDAYLEGLKLAAQVQRKSTMGRCNQGLSEVALIEGKFDIALQCGEEAINLFERLGMVRERDRLKSILENKINDQEKDTRPSRISIIKRFFKLPNHPQSRQ